MSMCHMRLQAVGPVYHGCLMQGRVHRRQRSQVVIVLNPVYCQTLVQTYIDGNISALPMKWTAGIPSAL